MASSAATRTAAGAAKVVKPIFSRDLDEAKRRVRELYRAWYREVPNTGKTSSPFVLDPHELDPSVKVVLRQLANVN